METKPGIDGCALSSSCVVSDGPVVRRYALSGKTSSIPARINFWFRMRDKEIVNEI